MRIVQKYGGSSLADAGCIRAAARRLAALAEEGIQVVAVVSAQADTTDVLARQARALDPGASGRELDACLAAGEQISAALLALAVENLGREAVSLTGWQAGIRTEALPNDARITGIRPRRILRELEKGKVVVVAGFQGIDPLGNITTLGRGGSDITAVALAAALKADRCQLFKDVDGIFDRDPRRFPGAVRFDRIGYDRMLQLIREGAQVLHRRSVELARERGICMEICPAFGDSPGTLVTDLE